MALGEQNEMVLTGKRVSTVKILAQGLLFHYPRLRAALQAFHAPALKRAPTPSKAAELGGAASG
ncbi:MAG: DUF1731 domain-containing protein [Janthinobacterium lividum]